MMKELAGKTASGYCEISLGSHEHAKPSLLVDIIKLPAARQSLTGLARILFGRSGWHTFLYLFPVPEIDMYKDTRECGERKSIRYSKVGRK